MTPSAGGDSLAGAISAPAFVSWQLTRGCDLACRHCCTDSAPGRTLPDELAREEALDLAERLVAAGVPKVMLCGGEPTLVPHFLDVAETLGQSGVALKIETNGQRFTAETAGRLSRLPVSSVQISLDGATPDIYARMRPGGSLTRATSACASVVMAGMPLEVTFAPTRLNIHEAEAVIEQALTLGAFRFNTGMLMRLGTAARQWERLEPSREAYARFFALLRRKERALRGRMEVAFRPWSLGRELRKCLLRPPATLLVLPNAKVKVSAALPFLCGDLRRQSVGEVWGAYRRAWHSLKVAAAVEDVRARPEQVSRANDWSVLETAGPISAAAAP